MGVSGFLISCARRRATSPQAWARWAETMSEMSSNTKRRLRSGNMAPRAIRVCGRSAPLAMLSLAAPSSNDCCQWSLGCSKRRLKNSANCCCTPTAKASKPANWRKVAPRKLSSGSFKMRAAPGLAERTLPSALSTSTPEVRLSKMVCKCARAESTCDMLRCTVPRASASCCVMDAKARVRPPNSSLPCMASLGVRSPAATWLTPSVSTSRGRAIWLPKITASKIAPNTARNRLSVRVPMYMRLRPSRASARSWYSRLALSTAKALATKLAGKARCTSKKRCSVARPTLALAMGTKALMRGLPSLPGPPSSRPSTQASERSARAVRNWLPLGLSGLS